MPLAADKGALNRHAGDTPAVGPRRDHGDVARLLRGPEPLVSSDLGADVERRGVDDDRGPGGDGLPVHVRDGGFERHRGRLALGGRRRGEGEGDAALAVERVLTLGDDLSRAKAAVAFLPPPARFAEVIALGVRDLHFPAARAPRPREPGHGGARHRRAEEVPRFDRGMHGVAGEARPGVGGDGDEELRRAVLGDAIVGSRHGAPAAVTLALHAHGIRAQRQIDFQRDGLIGGAERRQRDRGVLEHALLAVAEHPAQRVAAGGRPQRAERAVTDDGLGVHRLAGAVDTALGEHGGRFGAARVPPRALDVELPRREVGVPAVHRHDGAIGA